MVLAFIESVDPQDVSPGHSLSLANPHTWVRDGGDAVSSSSNGEGCSAIVHDGGVVVGGVLVVGVLLAEVVGHALINVLPIDPDVLVAVTPGLLVIEAQSVVHLMLDDAVVQAAPPVERQHLPASCPAQAREASIFVLNADVIVLVPAGHKAEAGFLVEGIQGVLNL